jgi:nucleoside-diphosphate-sugar epimerase
MHIAITGGSGRIGRATATLALQEGHQVTTIDRAPPPADAPNTAHLEADLADYDALERVLRGCDALIHLAAIPAPGSHPDHIVHNNNVVTSYNALRAAAEVGITRVCQASSVNAIGMSYSRVPQYAYLPVDEDHPTLNEDPYSLSKWICEQQADSIVRRYGTTIASLRFHWVVPQRPDAVYRGAAEDPQIHRNLWAYTLLSAAARACLLSLTAPISGHEVFFIAAPDTVLETDTAELVRRFYPTTPIRGALHGNQALISSAKAERLLGWNHGG